jgi:hypothetical protein
MLIRKKNGDLMDLKKSNFINDKLYYKKIMELKFDITKVCDNTEVKTHTSYIIKKYIE